MNFNPRPYKGKEFLITKKQYPPGTVLCKQGEPSDDIYLLQKGAIQVIVDDEVIQVIDTQGSFVGETASLLKQRRTASLVVKEECECMVIPGEFLEDVISQSPKVGINLLKVLCTRLLRTTRLLTRAQKEVLGLKHKLTTAVHGGQALPEETTSDKPKSLGERLIDVGLLTRDQLEEVKHELMEKSTQDPNLTLSQLLIDKGYLTSFQLTMFLQNKS